MAKTGSAPITVPTRAGSLTGLRFFAAFLVVLFHASDGLGRLPVVTFLVLRGTIGVTFFFVLSGFLLAWSSTGGSTLSFYRRRFARVYPLHLVAWLALVAAAAIFAGGTSAAEGVPTLLLVQAWVPDRDIFYGVNSPSWSLSCEFFFYALFPFLLTWLNRRTLRPRHLVILTVAYAAVVGVASYALRSPLWFTYVFPPVRLLEFVAGMVMAVLFRRYGWRPPLSLPAAGVLVVALYLLVVVPLQLVVGSRIGIYDAIMLPGFLLLIGAAATADTAGTASFLRRKVWVRLGEWSFALYITHMFVLRLFTRFFPHSATASVGTRALIELLFVLTAVAASIPAYYLVSDRSRSGCAAQSLGLRWSPPSSGFLPRSVLLTASLATDCDRRGASVPRRGRTNSFERMSPRFELRSVHHHRPADNWKVTRQDRDYQ